MKKIILSIAILFCCPIFTSAETSIDLRFETGKTIPAAATLVHNQINHIPWQGFIKVFPNNILCEIGPRYSFQWFSITARIGAHLKWIDEKLDVQPQGAIVLTSKWRKFKFISINEFSPYEGTEFFYEDEISYRFIGLHLESVFVEKQFEPFVGPVIYPKLNGIPGKLYLSYLRQVTGEKELFRVGYKLSF